MPLHARTAYPTKPSAAPGFAANLRCSEYDCPLSAALPKSRSQLVSVCPTSNRKPLAQPLGSALRLRRKPLSKSVSANPSCDVLLVYESVRNLLIAVVDVKTSAISIAILDTVVVSVAISRVDPPGCQIIHQRVAADDTAEGAVPCLATAMPCEFGAIPQFTVIPCSPMYVTAD